MEFGLKCMHKTKKNGQSPLIYLIALTVTLQRVQSLHNGAGHCRLSKFTHCSRMILVLLPAVSSLLYRAQGALKEKLPSIEAKNRGR